jgi:glycosyltransferase involved in cell wall biosynthesis
MHRFPNNKAFAFTVFDDTDLSTAENIRPIYHLLAELGMLTTKSVWPLASVCDGRHGGSSLQDPEYLEFILGLKELGFEIALHNVRNHDSTREMIEHGLEEFQNLIGHYPRAHANHSRNRDNIYWGVARFDRLRQLYRSGTLLRRGPIFEGHDPSTQYFWGDLCREKVDYVRNFVFREINLDNVNPTLPYHDPTRPFVKHWFSSCEGSDVVSFCETLCEANQDRLEAEGGVCIMHTHFACGFVKRGAIDLRAEQLLRRLSGRNGWFVPVSTLLDFLRDEEQATTISAAELAMMERNWTRDKLASLTRRPFHTPAKSDCQLPHNCQNSDASRPSGVDRRAYRIVHLTSAHPAMDVRIFHKECRSLARAGYEVIQIGNYDLNDTVDGVRLRGLGSSKGRLQRFTSGLFAVCREAFRVDGDLYHVHDPDLLIVGLMLRAAGRRVVYDIHEDLPTKTLLKLYLPKPIRKPLKWIVELVENAAAALMSGLITATPTLGNRFVLTHNNTVVVNNYPILDEFARLANVAWKSRDRAVTYVGGISEARGIEEMLAAMDLLPRTLGVKLYLAGWFYVQALMADLATKPQWQYVNWHGGLDRNGLTSLLGRVLAGLVILHPENSFITSQPTKLYEYMASGIPVIASDFPLWRSIIQTANCGILVDPFDIRSIASAIERLIANPDEAEAMGQRGRRIVEECFNWENEEKTLLSFYVSLLPGRAFVEAERVMA